MQYKYSSFLCLLTALLYAIKHILSKFILRLLLKFLQVAMPFPVFRGLHHECLEAILRKS